MWNSRLGNLFKRDEWWKYVVKCEICARAHLTQISLKRISFACTKSVCRNEDFYEV